MTKKEFEEVITPFVNRGIGGGVDMKMWNVIEMVYMNTGLSKIEVADTFWNHTGRWSTLESAVKEYVIARGAADLAEREMKKVAEKVKYLATIPAAA